MNIRLVVEVRLLNRLFKIETELPFMPEEDDINYLVGAFRSALESQLQDDIANYTLNGRLPK